MRSFQFLAGNVEHGMSLKTQHSRTTAGVPLGNLRFWNGKCEIEYDSGTSPIGDEEFQMRKQKGFSLIELLIVVAIILIIAAIAIPNLLRARIAANESSAVASIRTITTAETTYQSAYPTWGYADTMAKLGPPSAVLPCPASGPTQASSCLIDGVLAFAVAPGTAKSGYYFALAANQGAGGTLYLNYTVGA